VVSDVGEKDAADGVRLDRGVVPVLAALSLLNGLPASPAFDSIYFLIRPFAPVGFAAAPTVLFYFTSLLLALGTLMLAGVPAALYERMRGLRRSSPVSLLLWFAATLLLVWPALSARLQ
jgi:hypothetical protein